MSRFSISLESDLEHRYPSDIEEFWQKLVNQGNFKGVGGQDIAYAIAKNPNAKHTVVVSSGRIEGLIKYKEVVFDLFNNGYSVFIHDHIGQGFSDRLLTNPHKGYVDGFDRYTEDLHTFMQDYVLPYAQQNEQSAPHLLCHSMGGAIGALYLKKYPEHFDKVAFSAPMFGIAAPLPLFIANLLVNIGCFLNRLFKSEPWYFIGMKDYDLVSFKKNVLTHSRTRYRFFRDEYEKHPKAQLGGVTFQWLKQAILAMNDIIDNAEQIKNHCLLLQAGADEVVDNGKQQQVVGKLPNAEFKVIDDAKHELLLEADSFRVPSMNAIFAHFASAKAEN
ncbi:alpha/beta fold hydrolase [Alteromonadaceae bacterium M269]|nr:alpha/beta fold hydrolase [Alteromonadaceae bacterium M269]